TPGPAASWGVQPDAFPGSHPCWGYRHNTRYFLTPHPTWCDAAYVTTAPGRQDPGLLLRSPRGSVRPRTPREVGWRATPARLASCRGSTAGDTEPSTSQTMTLTT